MFLGTMTSLICCLHVLPGKQPVEVLTAEDIQKDYVVVRAKLDLLQKEPALVNQLSSE